MDLKESALFYSKILLFGEYGIIQDAMGLSIPYASYKGSLKTEGNIHSSSDISNTEIKKFFQFVKSKTDSKELSVDFDLKQWEQELEAGLWFDSSIPQGFGVGSSGALVAAIYDRYAVTRIENKENISNKNILALKTIFGQLESFFHGKSSGLDPLICYLNLPILISSKTELGSVTMPEIGNSNGAIFLLNTQIVGKTEPMINIFMEQLKNEGFRKMLKTKFKKYNDECIKAFLNKDIQPLFRNIKKLSKLALDNFNPMIPNLFHQLWAEGIDSNAYYLKLCGSGGGGFILGFTQDIDLAKEKLKNYQIDVIYRF